MNQGQFHEAEELGVICDMVSKPCRLTVKSRRLAPPATCELSFLLIGQLPSLVIKSTLIC